MAGPGAGSAVSGVVAGTVADTVAELVGTTLAGLGVSRAFGVVGSGNFAVTTALVAAGVPFAHARHEGGAATAADAYARTRSSTGRPDEAVVLTVHQGPGLTNALTGITEAAKSRTPLLVLAGEAPAAQVRNNFRFDVDAVVRGLGAVPERLGSAATAQDDVVRAWATAVHGRRTVVLSMPTDVQAAPAPTGPSPLVVPAAPDPVPPRPADVAALADLLETADRPVVVAGRGARGHGDLLRRLGERTGALLATSAVAHGLFAGDGADLGICGGFATDLTARLVRDADLVVALGCSLTAWTTRHGRLLGPAARVVRVDDDPGALTLEPCHLPVHGDVATAAGAVLSVLGAGRRTGYRTPQVLAALAQGVRGDGVPADGDVVTAAGERRVDPRALSAALDARLPAERVVTTDSGNAMGYPAAYLSVPDEWGFCHTQSFQAVGLGLATLVGAALAQPGRLPVLGTGDGGFLMGVSELETLVRLGIGAVVVVYDDAAYGAEVHHFGPQGAPTDLVRFPDADLAALARGVGCEAAVVRSVADLAVLDDWLAGPRSRPLVLDAKVASDGGSWWLAEAFRAH